MSNTQGQGRHDDDSLVEAQHPMASYPAFPAKQLVFGIAALVLLVNTFLPWWDAEIPLNRVNDTLNGWLLLTAGFSIGSLGATTGYSWFGNVLFGIVPVLPSIGLAVLLALRVLRLSVTPANLLSLYAMFSAIGSAWLLLYGTVRVGAANGVYPPMIGPWISLIVSVLLFVLCRLWWRAERNHFPATRFLGFGRARRPIAETEATASDDFFADLESDDDEDAPLSFDAALPGVTTSDAPRGSRGRAASTANTADSPADGPDDATGSATRRD